MEKEEPDVEEVEEFEQLSLKAAKKIDKQITKEQKKLKKSMQNSARLLLLGSAESGKSTVAKQMKIIHIQGGYSAEERNEFKTSIFTNVFSCMYLLIEIAEENGLPISDTSAVERIQSTRDLDGRNSDNDPSNIYGQEITSISEEQLKDLQKLWEEESIQKAFENSGSVSLSDNTAYLFSNLARIGGKDYSVTTEDVLNCRQRTTGVAELVCKVQGVQISLIDVGGQRNLRKKWIHLFQDVTGVIFCIAINSYDQVLVEDSSVNRLHDSLELFAEITNSRWFKETPMVVFLNKKDLFKEKIEAKIPLDKCFPEYTGTCYGEAKEFLQKIVTEKNETEKPLYIHFTQATDTDNVQLIFSTVFDIIFQSLLKTTGL